MTTKYSTQRMRTMIEAVVHEPEAVVFSVAPVFCVVGSGCPLVGFVFVFVLLASVVGLVRGCVVGSVTGSTTKEGQFMVLSETEATLESLT